MNDNRSATIWSSFCSENGINHKKNNYGKFITNLVDQAREAVKYWWLFLIIGIVFFVMGIIVFAYPAESYFTLAVLFGYVILFSGVFQIILAATSRRCMIGWSWILASGIIETVIGLLLIFNPGLSAVTLPIFFGFWLMFRSFSTIGLGSDMQKFKVSGAIWTIVLGVLLLILSIIILVQPLTYGTSMVIVWTGVALLFAGVAAVVYSIQLRSFHKYDDRLTDNTYL
ncbi:MAG: DUF308 domain-containing protein [Rikenellaceae bacterium]|nr:DUF308 domain-containing protein [Rikenellaceae bacterium]